MAKFSIIPKDGGAARYSGCPTFTGTYMKPGLLEFREIASPTPINWSVGDYVVYTRTGFTYRLYTIPQVKKQARSAEYGGAFVYQSVQFFDDSKQLEICPFRDLVLGDNRIHFSTQPSISTFEGVDGIARRIQACLDDMYPNKWVVQLATTAMGASAELVALMAEAREFTVSGVSLLGALEKVYEVWPDVGWTFSYNPSTGKNVITIGGAGLSSTGSYQYGKGNGLRSITKNVANADEIATRIFAYGSMRNMLPKWYNSQQIKDAESVDIQNLMLPVSAIPAMDYAGWGKTNVEGVNLPDPAKAFIDAPQAVMQRLGLRPKTYYFDGTGDLPDIYPSIREMTIGLVRASKSGPTDPFYPSTSVYADPDARVDTILFAPAAFDSGLAGNESGKANLQSEELPISASGTSTQYAGLSYYPFYHYQGTWSPGVSGTLDFSIALDLSGAVQLDGIESVKVSIRVKHPSYQGATIASRDYEIVRDGVNSVSLSGIEISGSRVRVDNVAYQVFVELAVTNSPQTTDKQITYAVSGGVGFTLENHRAKTFNIGIRQVGFDISAQAALGDGKTISMRTGKCAGRSFTIKSCSYVSATDSWSLEIIRSEDESLSQWFPNADYPIAVGDEFVLLDIAMPDEYILVAEKRLLEAARELLADVSTERWQYTPEIDAKFMVENARSILPAQNMVLTDADVVGSAPVSILIDTVSISEDEAIIPTYKVTLRDRKRTTFTESKGADTISSKPVTNSTKDSVSSLSSRGSSDSFFTLDSAGNITLKEQYKNLWVPGWLAAGGVGADEGGGGGLISTVYGESSLGTIYSAGGSESLTATFSAFAIDKIWQAVLDLQQSEPDLSGYGASLSFTNNLAAYLLDSDGKFLRDSAGKFLATAQSASINLLNADGDIISHIDLPTSTLDLTAYVSLVNGANNSTLTVNGVTADFYTKAQVDGLISGIHSFEPVPVQTLPTASADTMYKLYLVPSSDPQSQNIKDEYITYRTGSAGNYTYSWEKVGSTAIDLSGYVTLGTAQTISGAKTFSADLTLSESLVMGAAKHIDIGPARIEYDANTGAIHITTNQTGNNAPTIGFYADGFNSAGGIGNGGGGGGYGVERITTNEDGTIDFHFTGGDVTTVDLNHEHPQYPKYVQCTQSEYDALTTKDSGTLYLIPATA